MFTSLKFVFHFLIFQWKVVSAKFLQLNETPSNILRAIAYDSEPFIHYDQNERNYKGIEFNLVQVLADKLNLKLSIEGPKDDSSFDIVIGGRSISFDIAIHNMTVSTPYFQDNLTWCVRHSGFFPIYLNVFMLATPECWFLIVFGFGYGTGFLLFIFIQFDTEYVHRNVRDWHYTTWLISLPVIISMGPRFTPIRTSLRIVYGLMLFAGMLTSIFVLTYGISSWSVAIRRYQVSTQEEIISNEYRIFGSPECLEAIKFDSKVRIWPLCI